MGKVKVYTIEDVEELTQWFKQHEAEIPETIAINKSIKYPNLRETVPLLLDMAHSNWENVNFAGYIHRLEEIRDRMLEEQLAK